MIVHLPKRNPIINGVAMTLLSITARVGGVLVTGRGMSVVVKAGATVNIDLGSR